MKTKLLAILLCAAMILGIAACGSETTVTSESKKPSTEESKTEVKEESKEEVKAEVKEDPSELTLIMYGEMGTRREEFFKNEFHEAVLEELNIDLTVEFLTWGALTKDVQNRLMAGEKFAYMHIPSSTDQAQRGLCAEITQADIDTYLPNHAKMRGSKGFDCVKVNDKIVAVPIGNKPTSGSNKTITVRNDILKEVGWDYSQITDYATLLEACADVHEKYPDLRILAGGLLAALDSEITGHPTFGINTGQSFTMTYLDEDNSNVYSYYESDAFKKACDIMHEWVELGYQYEDILSDPTAARNDWTIGNALLYNGVPGNMIETGVKANMPETADLRLIRLDDYANYFVLDFDWAISVSAAAQEDVPDYLRLIDWIYASQDNYEFCIYGVEGTDWERNADGTINKLTNEMMFDDWFLQASCYHIFDPSISQEAIEEYSSYDEGAQKSKMSGFVFDVNPVSVEKAALAAVYSEYLTPIFEGVKSYDEHFEEALAKLKEAGLDKYVAEYQKQYAAWYDANRK